MANGCSTGYLEILLSSGQREENNLLYTASQVIHHSHNFLSQTYEKRTFGVNAIFAQKLSHKENSIYGQLKFRKQLYMIIKGEMGREGIEGGIERAVGQQNSGNNSTALSKFMFPARMDGSSVQEIGLACSLLSFFFS